MWEALGPCSGRSRIVVNGDLVPAACFGQAPFHVRNSNPAPEFRFGLEARCGRVLRVRLQPEGSRTLIRAPRRRLRGGWPARPDPTVCPRPVSETLPAWMRTSSLPFLAAAGLEQPKITITEVTVLDRQTSGKTETLHPAIRLVTATATASRQPTTTAVPGLSDRTRICPR